MHETYPLHLFSLPPLLQHTIIFLSNTPHTITPSPFLLKHTTPSPSLLSSNTPHHHTITTPPLLKHTTQSHHHRPSSPQTHHTPSHHHCPSSPQIHLPLILPFPKHLPTPQVSFVPQVPPAQMANVMMGMRAVAEVTIIDNDNGTL